METKVKLDEIDIVLLWFGIALLMGAIGIGGVIFLKWILN